MIRKKEDTQGITRAEREVPGVIKKEEEMHEIIRIRKRGQE